jgi:hypothetical protein
VASPPGAPTAGKPAASGAADGAKDEKYWRNRVASARDALSRSQTFADALQSQINALYTEFVNMSDPAQRSVIEQKRLAAIAEQDRVKADIVQATKAHRDIEDEARREVCQQAGCAEVVPVPFSILSRRRQRFAPHHAQAGDRRPRPRVVEAQRPGRGDAARCSSDRPAWC